MDGLWWFLNLFHCFDNDDFASPKAIFLSFYWGVSAHPLTISYQMMLGLIQEYGSLGVILVLWMLGKI